MVNLLSKLNIELKAYNDPVFFCKNILHFDPYPMQEEILTKFYCSDQVYTHMILVCGMRSGKTQLGAIATCYELFKLIMLGSPQEHYDLPPGQPIFLLHVANSRDQAKDTVFAQTAGLLENTEWFINHGLTERYNEFVFPEYNLVLRCEHSNSASLAGHTAKMVVMDETARFKDNKGKFSGEAVYFTVSRAVKTFGDEGKVFSVSSPIWTDDFQMRLYKKGKKIPTFLCYKKATWEMNPRITRESLEPERVLSPETFWRDYGARPSAAVEAYFRDHQKINAAFDSSVPLLIEENHLIKGIMPIPNTYYYLAGDPAVKNDAFGLALVHAEGDTLITDLVHRFVQGDEPEIDTTVVRDLIFEIANVFPLRSFIVDTWQYPETIQALGHAGVFVEQHVVKKAEYDCLKECVYTGKLKIPVNEKLNDELKSLELVKGLRIDHPRDGSKDMADALANAVFKCVEEGNLKPEVWRPEKDKMFEEISVLPPVSPIDEGEFHEFDI